MRLRLTLLLGLMLFASAACQGPPPTQYVIEITREVTRVVVVTPTPPSGAVVSSDVIVTPSPTASATATPTADTTPDAPDATATPDPFPTTVVSEIYVAEQRFQGGRMLWLQPIDQIWVLSVDEDGNRTWSFHEDAFEEGMPERDEEIVPPDEDLMQPIRGFGKLWRDNPEIRAILGWATENEFAHVTRYEYHQGGTVNADNEYQPGPGYHILESLYGDTLRFNEGVWTWETVE